MPRSPVVRFAARAALFMAVQCCIAAALLPLAFRRGQEGFIAAVRDKHARLDALRGRPRLIIAGGSTAAFGFDSAAVERATGRAVVNLALHAGLGQPYILAEAESAAASGDEIWLSPEFHFLWRDPTLAEEMWALLCARPAAWRDLRFVPVKTLLDQGPFQFLGHVARQAWQWVRRGTETPRGLYARSGFDERGDYVRHADLEPPRPLVAWGFGDAPLAERTLRPALERLRRAVRGCEAKGATVRIVLPVLHEALVRGSGAELERAVVELERAFPGRVVGTLDDITAPDDWFFDTNQHLTRAAAMRQTRTVLARAGFETTAPAAPSPAGPR